MGGDELYFWLVAAAFIFLFLVIFLSGGIKF
jgi:hypothetical protein